MKDWEWGMGNEQLEFEIGNGECDIGNGKFDFFVINFL